MSDFIIHQANLFDSGYTAITTIGEKNDDTGMNFGILKLKTNEEKEITSHLESAYLLMNGKVTFVYDGHSHQAKRKSLFDEDPTAIHFAKNRRIKIKADEDCELAVIQTENDLDFETVLFNCANMLESEERGKGLLDDTASRIVRTIFDDRNRHNSKIVLGEVITFPGKWSSYPPHFHPQPEIYHYRFTETEGFGHGELSDQVFKIKQFDTLKILDQKTHAQVAAPGYGMYYIWAIRHLEDNRYDVPVFVEEHDWTRQPGANERVWTKYFELDILV